METLLYNPFHEYLLLLSPDEKIKHETMEIKKVFNKEYGINNATISRPHITLVNFCQFESMEKSIFETLKAISKHVQPTVIELSGFGQFKESTIFIDVIENSSILNCITLIKSHVRKKLNLSRRFKPQFSNHLHLTIARKISASQFINAWKVCKDKEYNNSFIADEMLLLKREIDMQTLLPLSYYQPVSTFLFKGKKELNQQLHLF